MIVTVVITELLYNNAYSLLYPLLTVIAFPIFVSATLFQSNETRLKVERFWKYVQILLVRRNDSAKSVT